MEADWREGNLGREKCLFFKMQYKIFLFSRNSRRDITYNYVISARLGRNTYKEQYAFLYK